jgi:hypothetical protein
MLVGGLLIAVGLITIAWGHWLIPRQLEKVRERATPEGRERYDGLMSRPIVIRLFRAPAPVGIGAILVGAVFFIAGLVNG